MKRITIFILAVSSLLFACKKDAVQTAKEKTKPSLKEALSILRASAEKASKAAGNQTSQVDITQLNNGNRVTRTFYSNTSATFILVEDPGCNSTLRIKVTGHGTGRHIGNLTLNLESCFFIAPDVLFLLEGAVTAANGDKIYEKQTGGGTQASGLPFETYNIIGGTGRFAGATGSIVSNYSVFDPENNIFLSEQIGTITY